MPVRGQQPQQPAPHTLLRLVRLARRHQHGLPQRRHLLAQLGRGRLAARREHRQHRPLGLRQPRPAPPLGELAQVLQQRRPLLHRDRPGRRRAHERRELLRHREQRPPHRQQLHQRDVLVQRPLHLPRRRLPQPRARRQVHRRRIGGVQPDHRVRGLLHPHHPRRRRQHLPQPQPRPPLPVTDPNRPSAHHARILRSVTDNCRKGLSTTGVDTS